MTKLNLVRVTISDINTGAQPLPRDVVGIVRQRFTEVGKSLPRNTDFASIAIGYIEVPEEVLAGESERVVGSWRIREA